jgi:hypothetical protein
MSAALDIEASHRVEHWLDRHRTFSRIAGGFSMTWDPNDEGEHQREMLMAVAFVMCIAASSFRPFYAAAVIPTIYGVRCPSRRSGGRRESSPFAPAY